MADTPAVNPLSSPRPDREWQRLWFSLRAYEWRSLAILGIEGASQAEQAAQRLIAVAFEDEKTPVAEINALGMSYQEAIGVASTLQLAGQPLTLVTCDAPDVNPAMIPIVQAVTGIVVVVRLGETRLDAVKRTLDVVGRDKILATVTVG